MTTKTWKAEVTTKIIQDNEKAPTINTQSYTWFAEKTLTKINNNAYKPQISKK